MPKNNPGGYKVRGKPSSGLKKAAPKKAAPKAKAKLNIKKAIKKPGALRATAGVKKGEKIPEGKLDAMAKQPGKTGQRARFAKILKKFRRK